MRLAVVGVIAVCKRALADRSCLKNNCKLDSGITELGDEAELILGLAKSNTLNTKTKKSVLEGVFYKLLD
jgi:hypothetical protein